MKRYALFTFDQYEPSGGWLDFHSAHDSLGEAVAIGKAEKYQVWHVVDLQSGEIVALNDK